MPQTMTLERLLTWPNVAQLIALLDFVCIIFIVFVEQRNPTHAVAWVLAVLCFPGVGLIFYLFLGRQAFPHHTRRFRRKQAIDNAYQEAYYAFHAAHTPPGEVPFNDPAASEYGDVILMNQNYADSLFTQDNALTLLPSAQQKFEALLRDIEQAQDHIHLLYFIFRNDQIGRQLVNALAKKAEQGVEVRLLLDAWGCYNTPRRMFTPLIKAGGKVSTYPKGWWQHLITVNYRNHRKIVVIDGRIGYVGGINVGDEYLGKNRRYEAWRDTHLRLEGTAAKMLQLRFVLDWLYAYNERIDVHDPAEVARYFPEGEGPGKTGVQIVSSGPDTEGQFVKYGMIRMIDRAHETVYIQTPYLTPDDTFLEAIKMTAASGVDVRIMLPGTADHWYVYKAGFSYIQPLMDVGVRFYLYPGMIHAKTIVVDGRVATVGSTNISSRSFALNYETNAFIYEREFGLECERTFFKDMKVCKELVPKEFARRSNWQRFLESICRLISPLS